MDYYLAMNFVEKEKKKRGKNFVDVPWSHDGQTEEMFLKKVGTKL